MNTLAAIAVPADINRWWYVPAGALVYPIKQHLDSSRQLVEYSISMSVRTKRTWMFIEGAANLLPIDFWEQILTSKRELTPVFIKFPAPVKELTGETSIGFVVITQCILSVEPNVIAKLR